LGDKKKGFFIENPAESMAECIRLTSKCVLEAGLIFVFSQKNGIYKI